MATDNSQIPDDFVAAAPGPNSGPKLLLFAVAALAVGFMVFRATVADPIGPGTGKSTSYDWEVLDLGGSPVDLGSYKGKAVFLNVWATWCPPCVAEMPSIAKLSERSEFENKDLAFVLVSVDQAGLDKVQAFAQRMDLGNTEIVVAKGAPPEEFMTDSIPATYLIDPAGTIVEAHRGGKDWNTDEVAEKLLAIADR